MKAAGQLINTRLQSETLNYIFSPSALRPASVSSRYILMGLNEGRMGSRAHITIGCRCTQLDAADALKASGVSRA